jgi:hypothetical protein
MTLIKAATDNTEPSNPGETHERRACVECGEQFDPRFAKDGVYCFVCSVHIACACADDPE